MDLSKQEKQPTEWPLLTAGKSSDFKVYFDPNVKEDEQYSLAMNEVDIYAFKHKRRGVCFIINNIAFEDPINERKGAEQDTEGLENVFTQLGFKCETHINMKTNAMDDLLEDDLSKRDFTDDDCLVVVIMSHGDEDGIMGTETKINASLKYKEIEAYFYENQSLAGKPKLFFYSACQGGKYDTGVVPTMEACTAPEKGEKIPKLADFFRGQSTPEGYKSWRRSDLGTYYIYTILYVLSKHSHNTDLVTMMTEVHRLMSLIKIQNGQKKQIPETMNRLTKKLFFPAPYNN